MKTFFASLLGTLAALVLFLLGGALLLIVFIGVLAAIGDKPAVVQDQSYLVFDLSADIADAPAQFDSAAFRALFADEHGPQLLQLRNVTRALRAAATDDRIEGVVLHGSFQPTGYGTAFASLREVRNALQSIRDAGKPVVAHLETPDTRDFYVASVATELALDPFGLVAVPGLAAQPMFIAGALDRFGVGVQVTRVGKYKSAVEPFTRTNLSEENREQMTSLLGDVWTEIRDAIAASRGIEPDLLQGLIDRAEMFRPEDALRHKLVDRLAYRDEIVSELKQETGRTAGRESFRQVSLPTYIRQLDVHAAGPEEVPGSVGDVEGRVAIVYAEGAIVDGEGRAGEVGGETYAREIRRLRGDPNVKAIVLRVNSPGGSATASEHIQRELRLAGETKPVVISMGGYAASGGYWISAYSDRIYAEPSTITGSIGVFGVLFNIQELGTDLGLTWDTVKTGRFADLGTMARPQTPEELQVIQGIVDWVYEQFVMKVAEARALPRARVEEIAQGRVWSGVAAKELGLVDEIGGLADAVAYAAERAGLSPDFDVSEYPRRKDLAQVIAEAMERVQPAASQNAVVKDLVGEVMRPLEMMSQFNDPRGIYARLPIELAVQ